jgi:hypothetical protein
MNRMNIYLTQDGQKIIKKIDKIRGNQSKSEFILQSVQYMIDTHKLNNNILTPVDLPTMADDIEEWKLYFQSQKLTRLVDTVTKLDRLLRAAKQEVEIR